MPKIVEVHQSPDDELLIRCDCGDDHFLAFTLRRFHDTDAFGEECLELSLIDEYRTPRGLWRRIKAAVKLFLSGEYHRSGVLLNHDALRAVNRWCGGVIDSLDSKPT